MQFPRRLALAATSIALIVATAACGGEDKDPEATPSSSTDTSQSPPPTTPSTTDTAWQDEYTEPQLAGYEDALRRYQEYETRSEPIWAAGKATDRAEALFKQYYPSPLWQGRLQVLSDYEQVDVQVEGLADVYWSRAKSISDSGRSVVVDQCVDYTTVKVTQRGQAAQPVKWQQKPNLRTITLEKPKGSDWLIYGVVDASSGKARPCTP